MQQVEEHTMRAYNACTSVCIMYVTSESIGRIEFVIGDLAIFTTAVVKDYKLVKGSTAFTNKHMPRCSC